MWRTPPVAACLCQTISLSTLRQAVEGRTRKPASDGRHRRYTGQRLDNYPHPSDPGELLQRLQTHPRQTTCHSQNTCRPVLEDRQIWISATESERSFADRLVLAIRSLWQTLCRRPNP